MTEVFSTDVTINASPEKVWATLTIPEIMTTWMGEPEMKIEVQTSWQLHSPILIKGFHHIKFENKGQVIQFEKGKKLCYSHLNSTSRLPDTAENYSVLTFDLVPFEQQTQLSLQIENFPTETIRKHLEFYWRTTLVKIKLAVETERNGE